MDASSILILEKPYDVFMLSSCMVFHGNRILWSDDENLTHISATHLKTT